MDIRFLILEPIAYTLAIQYIKLLNRYTLGAVLLVIRVIWNSR